MQQHPTFIYVKVVYKPCEYSAEFTSLKTHYKILQNASMLSVQHKKT